MNLLVIGLYFALMLGVGVYGMRRARTTEDYLVAGRRLGPWLYLGTLSAVVLGGASTIGGVRLGYVHGISGLWLVFMLGLGIVILSLFVAKKITSLGVYTVAQMLGQRFGVPSQIISGVVMVAYDLMVAVTSTLAVGTVVDVLFDIPRIVAILVGGGTVVLYSVLGGMWSITLTDILQFAIMTVGIFAVLLPASVIKAGGPSGLRESLPDSYFSLTAIGGDTILTYFLIYFFGIIVGQDIWQRVFTARDERVATRAGLAAGLYCMLYAVAGAIIGMAAKVVVPNLSTPDNAFAAVTTSALPVGLAGLVLAAALAALMSTASACTLAASTILSTDVVRRGEGVRNQRAYVLGVGLVVILVSCVVQDVVTGLTVAYNLLVGGLLAPIIAALWWKRASSSAVLVSMSSGAAVVVLLMVLHGPEANSPIYGGLTVSAIALVLTTLVRPAPSATDRPYDVKEGAQT